MFIYLLGVTHALFETGIEQDLRLHVGTKLWGGVLGGNGAFPPERKFLGKANSIFIFDPINWGLANHMHCTLPLVGL